MEIKYIIWAFLSYGLTNIMVYGSIFANTRNNIELWGKSGLQFSSIGRFINGIITCVMCNSVWTGFFIGLMVWSPTNEIFHLSKYVSWFYDGILSSGIVWTINSIVEWFEEARGKEIQVEIKNEENGKEQEGT